MADKKISALTAASTPLAGTEVLPIVQSGSTVKVAVSDLTAGRAVSALSVAAGNVSTSGNTISSTDTNGNINIDPNGTGYVNIDNATLPKIRLTNTKNWTGSDPVADVGVLEIYTTDPSTPGGARVLSSISCYNAAGSSVPEGNLVFKTALGGGSGAAAREVYRMDTVGNIIPALAGTGVNFTANTPAAGKTSQLLNWYEEGTWTPTFNGGTVTLNNTCYYTRAGRLVTVIMDVTFGASASSSDATLTLPFTGIGSWGTGAINYSDYGTGMTVNVNSSGGTVLFRPAVNGGNISCSSIAGKRFVFSATYFAA